MSFPALRRPKILTATQSTKKRSNTFRIPDPQYVIVTLKGREKLVVSSDAYHGIISVGDTYKCVICQAQLELNVKCKETHKSTSCHLKMLDKFPHVEEYASNLIRQVEDKMSFCTICNVSVINTNLLRHLRTDVHQQELQRAITRASTYAPS